MEEQIRCDFCHKYCYAAETQFKDTFGTVTTYYTCNICTARLMEVNAYDREAKPYEKIN
jgi:Pyruvate/2-oxoacid:ferredoxin oxidoreductase delta subunit